MEHAYSSEEADRRMILNSIAGEELTRPPLRSHQGYDALNDVLHGRFAAASFAKASAVGEYKRHGRALRSSQLKENRGHTVDLDLDLERVFNGWEDGEEISIHFGRLEIEGFPLQNTGVKPENGQSSAENRWKQPVFISFRMTLVAVPQAASASRSLWMQP